MNVNFRIVVENSQLDNGFGLNLACVEAFLAGAKAMSDFGEAEYTEKKKYPTKDNQTVKVEFSGRCPERVLFALKNKIGKNNPYVAIFRIVQKTVSTAVAF